MNKTAFIFPGQGSQYTGMGKSLYENFPEAKEVFNSANEALKEDLASLCFNGPDDALSLTRNTQPAILTVSVAALKVLNKTAPVNPSYVAGHSLGEYSALVASGGLEFKDAVRIVRARGEFMQDAVPVGVGLMAAVIGMERELLEAVCRESSVNGQVVLPANYNSPGQIVISGHKEAVENAIKSAKEKGAKRALLLPVSAPFHSPLMESAAERLAEYLENFNIFELKTPVVSNVEAVSYSDCERTKELLRLQMFSPVRWEDSVGWMGKNGVTTFVEIGPGKVLTGLSRRIVAGAALINIEDADSITKWLETIKAGG